MESVPFLEPRYLWLIAASLLLALEALGASGVGLVFGGLAALLVGILLEMGVIAPQSYILQIALWFALTGGITALLYKPLKRWRVDANAKDRFENITGTTARVAAGGLMLGRPGKVYWSGTMMNAQISENSQNEAFLEDDIVTVMDVRGNYLIVTSIQDTPPTPDTPPTHKEPTL